MWEVKAGIVPAMSWLKGFPSLPSHTPQRPLRKMLRNSGFEQRSWLALVPLVIYMSWGYVTLETDIGWVSSGDDAAEVSTAIGRREHTMIGFAFSFSWILMDTSHNPCWIRFPNHSWLRRAWKVREDQEEMLGARPGWRVVSDLVWK